MALMTKQDMKDAALVGPKHREYLIKEKHIVNINGKWYRLKTS